MALVIIILTEESAAHGGEGRCRFRRVQPAATATAAADVGQGSRPRLDARLRPNDELQGPEYYPVREGCVVVHVIHGSATLSAGFPVESIDQWVAGWRRIGFKRQDARETIAHLMQQNLHVENVIARGILVCVIAIAFTSRGADTLRQFAAEGFLRLTCTIETYSANGGTAVNFRLAGSDQRQPPMIIPLAEMPPTAAIGEHDT
jgi:hypothetical protein